MKIDHLIKKPAVDQKQTFGKTVQRDGQIYERIAVDQFSVDLLDHPDNNGIRSFLLQIPDNRLTCYDIAHVLKKHDSYDTPLMILSFYPIPQAFEEKIVTDKVETHTCAVPHMSIYHVKHRMHFVQCVSVKAFSQNTCS